MAKKIKSVKRFHADYKNFSYSEMTPIAEEEYLELVVEMDNAGNILLESKFDPSGELEEKNTYRYDANGKLIEHYLLYAVDDMTEKRILTRDEKGNLLSEVKFYGDESGEKVEYSYDANGNVTGINRYDEEGEFLEKEVLSYDDKNSLTQRIAYGPDNKQIRQVSFALNEGNTAVETEFDNSGKPTARTEITFNEKGKEEKLIQFNADGKVISRTNNIYDEHGNVIRREINEFYARTISFAYDEKNRLISQETYDGNGLLLRKNIFSYDDDGNLLTEQTFEIDVSRGGRDKHFGTRYEYTFL